MELLLVMAAATVLLMVLAFLSLTREDRELASEWVQQDDPLQRPRHLTPSE